MDDVRLVEVVADEAEPALGVELAVVADDTGRFLAAMLEGVKAESRDRRRFGVPKNTKDPAFLAESVIAHLGQAEIRKGIAPDTGCVIVLRHGCLPLKHPPQELTQCQRNGRSALPRGAPLGRCMRGIYAKRRTVKELCCNCCRSVAAYCTKGAYAALQLVQGDG